MNALTREELFLQAMATGDTSNLPEPQSRKEIYMKRIAENGGGVKSWSDLGEEIVEHEELVILDYARFSLGETLVVPEQIIPGCTYRVSFDQISPKTVTATGTSITVDGVTISNSGEDSLYFLALMHNHTYVTIIREAYEDTTITPLDEKYIPDSVKCVGNLVVQVEDNFNGTGSADKTYSEIYDHLENNGHVEVVFFDAQKGKTVYMPIVYKGDSANYVFSCVLYSGEEHTETHYVIQINSSNEVTITTW